MQLLTIARFAIQNPYYNIHPCKGTSLVYRQFITITECNIYSTFLKNISSKTKPHLKLNVVRHKSYIAYTESVVHSFKRTLKKVPSLLKGRSFNVFKHCAEQCEFIIAHRLRRSMQILNLYTKLWDETALKQLLHRMRQRLLKSTKHFLLGSAVIFNWENERIPDDDMNRYLNELELIKELKRKNYCHRSSKGQCDCFNCLEPGELGSHTPFIIQIPLLYCFRGEKTKWSTFVNQENLTVWKKEEINHIGEGLYCYKLYATYDDVSALDFLEAQVDLTYRLMWDDSAVNLITIDSEQRTCSDVIYWETKWPKLFRNRDYVFNRRYLIDRTRKVLVLVNRSTVHPTCPVYPNKQRVSEYWSYMVVKPITDLDRPGIEFSLTYFDNPGMAMPSSLSSWVTATGMPSFLQKLHAAAKDLRKHRKVSSLLPDSEGEDDRGPKGGQGGPKRRGQPDNDSNLQPPKPPRSSKGDCPNLPKLDFKKLCDGGVLSFF